MSTSPRFRSTAVEQAEAVLVEQYPRLVRLAYLTLPDSLGRHGRVLLAHRAVQRALPRRGGAAGPGGPDGSGGALAEVRVRVLRGCLAPAGRTGAALARAGWPPVPPFVWGLRLWPPAGGIEEVARVLAGEPAPVRAAFVLHRVDGLPEETAARLLGAAGAPADAMARALALGVGETLLRELRRPEFDASVVSTRPTDLLRRRRRVRAGWAAAAALAVVAGALAVVDPARPHASLPVAVGVLDPARLERVPAQAWADTARIDFTAWPARGGRTTDRALLGRALGAWASASPPHASAPPQPTPGPPAVGRATPGSNASGPHAVGRAGLGSAALVPAVVGRDARGAADPGRAALGSAALIPAAVGRAGSGAGSLGSGGRPGVAPVAAVGGGVVVRAAPGADTDPPRRTPQLLYAGDSDGRAVVLLLDGDRVVRYAEAVTGRGARELDFARTDEAGVTTAAALTLVRSPDGGRARYLLAPWIAAAGTRDLLRAGEDTKPLALAADGVTAPVEVPRSAGACAAWPALEVTSSARIVEKHSFVLADLGTLTPVHLTYTPLPDGPGAAAARQPREATGAAARAAWAATACRLPEMRGMRDGGVRAVNIWEFASSELPDGGGRAVWSCTRTSSWAGPGDVLVRLSPAAGPPQDVARAPDTAACGRFGQHLLAGTRWRSPAGRWYLLAAGSREVTGITASGAVRAEARGRTLAAPAGPEAAAVELTGRLASGGRVTALDGGSGGRD
ncbi:hypothetical protein EES37_27890 [Streptomyces sp. ADI91-18]|uniref:hypothetical protein n=1 Tax=Streptomyces sp. ADI91-18 TaxID=1522755 RepID=UPI000F54DFB3|nr:hypothetical protein [Streptomyces sp. ADI91-18]RPK35863.1 hypothetical protein EES37_27890 [Streptomyces sp. ADI91-18]